MFRKISLSTIIRALYLSIVIIIKAPKLYYIYIYYNYSNINIKASIILELKKVYSIINTIFRAIILII
jgi:hypothetical protein